MEKVIKQIKKANKIQYLARYISNQTGQDLQIATRIATGLLED